LTRGRIAGWVEGYERAWRTAGTGPLAELFAADAVYSAAPFSEPLRGLEAIARFWEEEREGPEEDFTMTSEIVAVEGGTGVVRVDVHYGEPVRQHYLDLWVIVLGEDGRCTSFEEWPFWPRGTPGSAAGAAAS
jgi:hypothetical protein